MHEVIVRDTERRCHEAPTRRHDAGASNDHSVRINQIHVTNAAEFAVDGGDARASHAVQRRAIRLSMDTACALPIEKLFQSMTAFCVVCLMARVVPLVVIEPAPPTNLPPLGSGPAPKAGLSR